MKKHRVLKAGLATGLVLWVGSVNAQTSAVLIYNDTQPAIKFAAAELKAVLEKRICSL
ncbi:MAG: hypothetical protein ACI9ZF_001023 [Bradyrhizobium sp.]|jgi:hypothetical protein